MTTGMLVGGVLLLAGAAAVGVAVAVWRSRRPSAVRERAQRRRAPYRADARSFGGDDGDDRAMRARLAEPPRRPAAPPVSSPRSERRAGGTRLGAGPGEVFDPAPLLGLPLPSGRILPVPDAPSESPAGAHAVGHAQSHPAPHAPVHHDPAPHVPVHHDPGPTVSDYGGSHHG